MLIVRHSLQPKFYATLSVIKTWENYLHQHVYREIKADDFKERLVLTTQCQRIWCFLTPCKYLCTAIFGTWEFLEIILFFIFKISACAQAERQAILVISSLLYIWTENPSKTELQRCAETGKVQVQQLFLLGTFAFGYHLSSAATKR